MNRATRRLTVVTAISLVAAGVVSAGALPVGTIIARGTDGAGEAIGSEVTKASVACSGRSLPKAETAVSGGEGRSGRLACGLRAPVRLAIAVVDVLCWRSFPGHAVWRLAGTLAWDAKRSLRETWLFAARCLRC